MKNIGEIIKEKRLAANLTQVQLAEMAQIQQAHLSMIENNTNGVSYAVLVRIMEALGCKIEFVEVQG